MKDTPIDFSFDTTNPEWRDTMALWGWRLSASNTGLSDWLTEAEAAERLIGGEPWTVDEVAAFGAPVTAVDIAGSSVDIMAATICALDPRVIVRSRLGDFVGAEVTAAVLQYWYRELQLKTTLREWVLSTLVFGQGYAKIGVMDDRPWITCVDPRLIRIDPVATSLHDARWVAERQMIDVDTLMTDPLYDGRRDGLRGHLHLSPDVDADAQVPCWEVYDRRRRQMLVLCPGHDQPLRVVDYDFNLWEQYPYERLVFRRRPFSANPQSDVTVLANLQRVLNRLLSSVCDSAERAKTVWLAADHLGDRVVQRLKNAAHGEVVLVPDLQAVRAESMHTLSGEAITALQTVMSMIREQTGISDYLRGASVRGVSSATEAAIISHGDQLRLSERRESLEIGLRNLSRYLYKILRHSVQKSHLVEIDPRAGRWQKISPSDLAGEYEFEIEHGFVSPLDRGLEIGRQTEAIATLSPYVEAGIVKIKPLLSDLLRAQGHDPDAYLQSDAEAAAAQQAADAQQALIVENEALRAQIAQVEELIQSGALALTQGDDATAVPITEVASSAEETLAGSAQRAAAEAMPPEPDPNTIPELEI